MSCWYRRCVPAALEFGLTSRVAAMMVWESGLKPMGLFAGGELSVRWAGVLVTDTSGGNDPMQKGEIVAGAPKVVAGL